jgi:tetratricopeptide (TPR) repeat protein
LVQELTSGKDDRESRFTRAQIYEKTKRYDLMAEELEALLAQSRTDDEKSSVLFMSGAMYERQKRYDEAESAFRKVLELDPDNSSAMNYLGYMFADRNVKLEEALQLIKRALEYDPANGAYLDSLGWVYYRMDRLPEAEETLLIAAQKVPRDPVVHDHLGDVYFGSGKLREAIAQWKVSLREWTTSPASEKDLAQMASVQKKLEGAEVQLASESTGAASKEH